MNYLLSKREHWKNIAILLMVFDAGAIFFSYFLALFLRFDFIYSAIPSEYLNKFYLLILPYIIGSIIIYSHARLYKTIWRFASYNELIRSITANLSCICLLFAVTVFAGLRMPWFFYFFGGVLQFVSTTGIRFSYRFYLLMKREKENTREAVHSRDRKSRVMIVGAGQAGQMVLRDILSSEYINDHVVCIVDDNKNKWNRFVEGVPVMGGIQEIPSIVEGKGINKIYLAVPSVSPLRKKEILDICKETGCELKTLPGIYQLVNGEVSLNQLKDVEVEDLLGRDPIKVNMDEIFQYNTGKTILVTGGGGSIGSELCRQIAAHHPKKLIILDIYENNAHAIGLELRDKYPQLDMDVLIGSVRDAERIQSIFKKYRPQIVYHAAAHKHVPLMEDSPNESIKNNVLGTYKTAYAAMMYGCERFVLISTDKAVNPTNIMGASKRLCEMIIQTFDKCVKDQNLRLLKDLRAHSVFDQKEFAETPKTEFVAVRFGNVLGSNGSVIPRFKEQIAKGGPVTVTHPDIIRYFMTIPEAVSLVLQAGASAKGGEIFVLDMGDPVKIDTLARNLIKLSGLKPDEDICIEYTGLRPGEKLYEEKLMAEEGIQKTDNDLIHIGKPIPFDESEFIAQLKDLIENAYGECDRIRLVVKSIVTTYKEAEAH